MDRKLKGRLAEAKVVTYLLESGYEVYLPFSDNSKYDVLAIKDGAVKRISTKFTSVKKQSGSWVVEMRQIYRGKNIINIDKFDNTKCDLIAVYIGPIDKVVLVDAQKSTARGLHITKELTGEIA